MLLCNVTHIINLQTKKNQITAHELIAPLEVTAGVVTACAVEALREVAQGAEPKLLEPQMKVSFQVDHRYVGDVVADVSGARRGTIESVEMGVTTTNILAEVPLKELIGYSTCFRSITSGNGTFSMVFVLRPLEDPHSLLFFFYPGILSVQGHVCAGAQETIGQHPRSFILDTTYLLKKKIAVESVSTQPKLECIGKRVCLLHPQEDGGTAFGVLRYVQDALPFVVWFG